MKQRFPKQFGVLVLCGFFSFELSTSLAQGGAFTTLTITNPTPEAGDRFGDALAAAGPGRMLIGAGGDDTGGLNSGAAYLFSTNGALLTTFTNPTPAAGDLFGGSVAAVGSDLVCIGAYGDDTGASGAGAAYLFSTNGILLTTITNPTPGGDQFGISVAAVGTDRVLIGAWLDDTGASDSGAAYLFGTNGVLLATFTNPTPALGDIFGSSVAAGGSDWVLVGAPYDDTGAGDAGAAYLFNTNGALLTTFTNPTPATSDFFGAAVTAVGADRVLIGAHWDDTGAANAGAAYLFSTNGSLLTTFTNPTPATPDQFGNSLAAMGNEQVLIGAYFKNTGAQNAGTAYLYGTDGTLFTTFTNPTPVIDDTFGRTVAAIGTNLVLIGAPADDTGAEDAGTVYLFIAMQEAGAPALTISSTAEGEATISWTQSDTNYVLQESLNLWPENWTNAPSGSDNPTVIPVTSETKFFRLIRQ